jgi:hypothetical protein
LTADDPRPVPSGAWRFIRAWVPRRTPDWAPNPLAAIALFALEALIVFVLALVGFGIAAMALWVV